MEKGMTKEWFVGFIEGEGNFHVGLRNTENIKSYPFDKYPFLQFRIFLREDDKEVLGKIQEFLGFGRIYKKKMDYNRKLGFKTKDQYNFVVGNVKDLLELKKILSDTNLFTKKEKDIKLFFKILDMKIAKKHLEKEGYEEMMSLISQINSGMRDNFKKGSNRNLYSNKNSLTPETPKYKEIKA